jgi:hypothetical protein
VRRTGDLLKEMFPEPEPGRPKKMCRRRYHFSVPGCCRGGAIQAARSDRHPRRQRAGGELPRRSRATTRRAHGAG